MGVVAVAVAGAGVGAAALLVATVVDVDALVDVCFYYVVFCVGAQQKSTLLWGLGIEIMSLECNIQLRSSWSELEQRWPVLML